MTNAVRTAQVTAPTTADAVADYLQGLRIKALCTQAPTVLDLPTPYRVAQAAAAIAVQPVKAPRKSPVKRTDPPHGWAKWSAPSMLSRCLGCGKQPLSQVHLDPPTHYVSGLGKFAPLPAGALSAPAMPALPAPTVVYAGVPVAARLAAGHAIDAAYMAVNANPYAGTLPWVKFADMPVQAPSKAKAPRAAKKAPVAPAVANKRLTAIENARAATRNQPTRRQVNIVTPLVTA